MAYLGWIMKFRKSPDYEILVDLWVQIPKSEYLSLN